MASVVVPSLAHNLLGAPFEAPLAVAEDDWKLHVPAVDIDKKDADTPDNWVPRDPRILRLTGRHPLNCEPPMDHLMSYGFITPPSIHFVRNHGAVPKISWSSHRIEVNGLVNTPISISMDELIAMPSITLPVTLVCAGNRRKEENMVKKSIGFNWGPCATSTTYWTGVRLRDILLKAGIKTPDEGANFVSFRGPKGELPKGDDGSYGTSLTYTKAMDLASDVIVAYKQNGRWLTPDHGFPVRIVIPGFIGGRMVKWLSEITVTETESNNFYHYHDNRVMPSHVDEALAKAEGWWFKPDFIINDLNINSAVARPWHDEVISLAQNQPYTIKGYAYSGGGRKIIRAEVSLDDGETWRLAEIKRFEKPNEYGKYWCWVHWDIEVQTFDFLKAKEVLCRAWDESMNTQPTVITWNVMGMMNNCYFRIKILPHTLPDGTMGLRFQHPAPVEVGELGGIGWREEENLRQQALASISAGPAAPVAPPVKVEAPSGSRTFTMAEVAEHNTEESCWFVHEGKVYDATPFLEEHPGGAESILIVGGMDATEDFNAIHSSKAKAMLKDYYLGELVESKASTAEPAKPQPVPSTSTSTELVALNPREKISLRMTERIEVSPNSRIYRFALPSPEHKLGLPCGKHLFVYANVNGESVMRAYTPISSDDDKGKLDLLIKVYFKNQHPNFPEGGKMSQYLDSLQVGDEITVKGPVGHFVYEGRGAYQMHKHKGVAKHFSMLAGGTGITPVYQVMKAVLKDADDTTTMSLLYANNGEEDILLREELDELANNHPDRLKVWYVLSKAPEGWQYSTGYITHDLMKEKLFPAASHTLGLMCGPPGLLNNVCVPGLEAMGYTKDTLVLF
mmetsp:Transcript_31111/g.69120  ORF Transcript_31111/g.69120 Transcript_31111/m.69120 type:complete len:849 (+) Transcript_31111:85-2631(+)|eukprot:CAMPEP_0202890092 /NCGR_PEP_ID=MMETSP1392-20130828/605_1 /ASSEMBLY_ACC=CAM_ASM_000868 /TAXON_ID=225041 /ORGANISM="Chlamydomonas chlamydogama, Strain SAG 11-48b" /LENGTH=848 /DNA_ID=CAMNT_0049573583 /DNA_START=80 /DNA_END=2626 /DNA_ORIENTATION=-